MSDNNNNSEHTLNNPNKIEFEDSFFRTIFENTGTAMSIVEEDRTITLVNSKFEELSGYRREDIEGKMQWVDFVKGEDREKMLRYHAKRRMDSSQVPKQYEFRFVGKDGKHRNILINIDMIPGTKKSIASMIDITERREIERAIMKSEERKREVEKRASNLVENSPIGIGIAKLSGGLLSANQTLIDMLGYDSISELREKTFLEMTHPDDRKQTENLVKGLLTGDYPFMRHDKRFIRKDGSILYSRTTAWLNRSSENDDEILITGLFEDQTDRKLAEKQLQRTEFVYKLMLENAPFGIITATLDWDLLTANKAYLNMVGYDESELKKKGILGITHPDDRHVVADIASLAILEDYSKTEFEKRYITQDGRIISVEVTSWVIFEDNIPSYFVALFHDVTRDKMIKNTKTKTLQELGYNAELFIDIVPKISGAVRIIQGLVETKQDELSKTIMKQIFAIEDSIANINDRLRNTLEAKEWISKNC